MAALGLLVADGSPSVLDPSINPLVPVLRNNFWLTIHVLTITLSYGAFTLALGVANFTVGLYLFRPERTQPQQTLQLFIYRSIQIGVVLLAAGTILGGVWANQSWGRFWGWDPKEVWALIALLGYLALLHGRFAGWVKGFGLTIGAIVAYLLILMAWYGVNFILGVGLHSYGFSSGGAKFVSLFVAVEMAWVLAATFRIKLFPQKILKNA
jgi:ABC-type transport system involved in cytochrome c biogenesis permease subunit